MATGRVHVRTGSDGDDNDRDVTLAQVVDVVESLFPPDRAQSWDRVGLVSGDPQQAVRRVHFAVDPTLAVVQEAVDVGADLLVTHHPLLLRGIHSVATTTAKGATVTALVVADLALYCAHTSADSADVGVNTALAAVCGLDTTTPLAQPEGVALGLVGDLPESISLRDLARRLDSRLPCAAGGIRVAGPPAAPVTRIALLGGAGDSLFDAVRAARADVYVTADLRHHPALEAREEAQVNGGTPYLIDVGHWAGESLWLDRAAADLRAGVAARHGVAIETTVSSVCTDPWTFVVGAQLDGRPDDSPEGDPA